MALMLQRYGAFALGIIPTHKLYCIAQDCDNNCTGQLKSQMLGIIFICRVAYFSQVCHPTATFLPLLEYNTQTWTWFIAQTVNCFTADKPDKRKGELGSFSVLILTHSIPRVSKFHFLRGSNLSWQIFAEKNTCES